MIDAEFLAQRSGREAALQQRSAQPFVRHTPDRVRRTSKDGITLAGTSLPRPPTQ
jgi:hypothetical protein